jgi:thymidine phosphorylase
MQSLDDSKALSHALVKTGAKFGVKAEAVISDMNQPLGRYVGNAHEIYECIKILRGESDERSKATADLSIQLSARMLLLSGIVDSMEKALARVELKLSNGHALESFRRNIGYQGGDPWICDHPETLLEGRIRKHEIKAPRAGFIAEIDTLAVGNALSEIGGGRVNAEDDIDFGVGYECIAQLGDKVAVGDPIGILFYRAEASRDTGAKKLAEAYSIQEDPVPQTPPLIHEVISA